MLKEFLDKVMQLTEQAQEVKVLHPKAEPDNRYFLTAGGQIIEERIAGVGPRAYEFYDLDGLADGIRRWLAVTPKAEAENVLVMVGREAIKAILDETGDRRERFWMNLPFSQEFNQLAELDRNRRPWTQRQLLEFLRVHMANRETTGALARFRELQFNSTKAVDAVSQAGRESLGKNVLVTVHAGGQAPPDTINFKIPVYRDIHEFPQSVTCAVSVDYEAQTFCVIPIAGELADAQRNAATEIRNALTDLLEGKVDVLLGNG